jgi:ribose-phosphate pyrophosphokinase
MNIIGDVRGKHAVIIDDMIDTAGTTSAAARVVLDKGAKSVIACATHGVLSGPAIERITSSALSEVIISDTIPLSAAARGCSKIKVLSVSRLLGEAIKRIHHGDSISNLFV